MKTVDCKVKTVEELLSGSPFRIDYYQREYRWGSKHLNELVTDLYTHFTQYSGSVKGKGTAGNGSSYFLGSIVVNDSNNTRSLVDGQQRITTIMLILIYLDHLQQDKSKKVTKIPSLIEDDEPDGKKFKLDVEERIGCMKSLLSGESYNGDGENESVNNLINRYTEIEDCLPYQEMNSDDIKDFSWWLIRNVKLVEIVTHNEEDAYMVFEAMNDRGLSLSNTDMLRGYILANIGDEKKRNVASDTIKRYRYDFNREDGNSFADFLKTWLRSQYAETIRDSKKNSVPQDFELIATEYHRWIRNNLLTEKKKSNDFFKFVTQDMKYYAEIYKKIITASANRKSGMESVMYNKTRGFTLQSQLILSGIKLNESSNIIKAKIGVISDYIDIWRNLRVWNSKSNNYDTVKSQIFKVMMDIRHLPLADIQSHLYELLIDEMKVLNFDSPTEFSPNRRTLTRDLLARITDWMEKEINLPGSYDSIMVSPGTKGYDIEHILSSNYDDFSEEFKQRSDFDHHRNLIGGLLILPKSVNRGLGEHSYKEKLKSYSSWGLLAASLDENYYKRNPMFAKKIKKYNLNFRPLEKFGKDEILERSELYCSIAKLVWCPKRLLDR